MFLLIRNSTDLLKHVALLKIGVVFEYFARFNYSEDSTPTEKDLVRKQ